MSIAKYMSVLLAGLALAAASSTSGVSGAGFLVTSAGAAWPWLWLGFFGAHSLRELSTLTQVLGGMVATALPFFVEAWFDMLLGTSADDQPFVGAVIWGIAGLVAGFVTAILNVLYRSPKLNPVLSVVMFQGLSLMALFWSIRDRLAPGSTLYDDLTWYALWGFLHIAMTAFLAILAGKRQGSSTDQRVATGPSRNFDT